jgi:hypothetical protein
MNDNMSKEQGAAGSPVASTDGQKSCKMCGHGMCHCGCGHRHFWLRWLLGLIILLVVFWLGVKVGEFKGAFGRGFGRNGSYIMRSFRTPMRAYPMGTPSGMMQGGNGHSMMTQPTATSTTAK